MTINNAIYDTLGDRWYFADDDPVALLRAEHRSRTPWILSHIRPNDRVLDLGCGAGLLANNLSTLVACDISGIDQSASAITVAHRHIPETALRKPHYLVGDAQALPFENALFDAVLAMDFLEHTDEPQKIFSEVHRVLKPGGLFLTHTFSKNWLSYLLVIRAVEWFIPNTPKDLHKYSLFLTPEEQNHISNHFGFELIEQWGLEPVIDFRTAAHILVKRRVPSFFQFSRRTSIRTGYCSLFRKR